MKRTTDCPNCGARITIDRRRDQGWLFCGPCQSIFFTHDSLRENWPSLYRALKEKKSVIRSISVT